MQRFSEDEAQEILRRAAQAPLAGEYTRDDLVQSAAELGISPDALARAEAEVREDRLRRAFEKEQKIAIRTHLTSYVLINAMLIVINLMTSPQHLWFLYSLLGWGIGIAVQIMHVRNRDSEEYRKAFDEFRERQTDAVALTTAPSAIDGRGE